MPMDELLIFRDGNGIMLKKIFRKPNAVERSKSLLKR